MPKYDNSERLETVSHKDWCEALDELTTYLKKRLKGRTKWGALCGCGCSGKRYGCRGTCHTYIGARAEKPSGDEWLTNGSTMVQVTNNDAKTGGYYVTENKNENK